MFSRFKKSPREIFNTRLSSEFADKDRRETQTHKKTSFQLNIEGQEIDKKIAEIRTQISEVDKEIQEIDSRIIEMKCPVVK